MINLKNHFDVIVIGAGPAGLTAGIYLSRARLKTLIVNKGTIGGQLVLLTPGGRSRTLGKTGEENFKGKGISYCAPCKEIFIQSCNN